MPSYADVVAGRLLLQEGTPSLGGTWSALFEMAAALRAGREEPLLDAVTATGSAGPDVLERVRRNVPKVLQAERERTLARMLHLTQLAPSREILAAFEAVRQSGFERRLGDELVAAGVLGDRGRVADLYQRAEGALLEARRRRELVLHRLLHGLPQQPGPEAPDQLREALQLCEVDLDLAPYIGDRVGREEGDPLAAAQGAGDAGPKIAPEDCPIYGYEIVEELGKGAMGVVYKARHVHTDRMTALKVLPLRLAAKTQYLERFKREAMAVMRLQHDNVVRAYDFGGSEDYYYLALEFVDGETLDRVLAREGGVLPERRALDIARQVARGLGCAFAHGVIHRDVKPENVMLTREGTAKLCDFGIVKLSDLEDGTLTMSGTTVGTPFYISPEQARGEDDLDIRSDLYSLGITLFHLATGRVPFTGKSQGAILVRHILEEVPDPRTFKEDLSEGLAGIVLRLTRKKREDRFDTPEDAARAIDALLGAPPGGAATPEVPGLAPPPREAGESEAPLPASSARSSSA